MFVPPADADVPGIDIAARSTASWREVARDWHGRVALTGAGSLAACAFSSSLSASPAAAATLAPMAATPLGMAGLVLAGCVVGSLSFTRLAKSLPMQAALGLSLGVLFSAAWGAGAATPLLAAMLGTGAVLQAGLCASAHKLVAPTWTTMPLALGAVACTVAMAFEATLATGSAVLIGLHVGLAGLAVWAISATALAVVSNASMLLPQRFVQKLKVDAAVVDSMRLEGLSAQPTVLQPPEALCASLRRLRPLSSSGQAGLPVYALSGGAATGKTCIAQGIAQALDGDLVLATANRLRRIHMPIAPLEIINLIALFGQADMHAQTTKRQTVLVIDEADTLLVAPKGPGGFPSPVHVCALFLLRVVMSNHSKIANRLSVVFVTNHVEAMRWWLAAVDAKIISVSTPDTPTRTRMAVAQLQSLQDTYRHRGLALDLTRGPGFDVWANAVAADAWHGRDIAASVAGIQRSIDAARFEADGVFSAERVAHEALMDAATRLQAQTPTAEHVAPVPVGADSEALYTEAAVLETDAAASLAEMARGLVKGLMELQVDRPKRAILRQSISRMELSLNYLNARTLLSGACG